MPNSNSMFKGLSLIIMFYLMHTVALSQNKIYYVDSGKKDNNGSGLSWATAKNSIGYAMALAQAGDQIWVKKGAYLPTHDSTLKLTNSNKIFFIKDGVQLYGGFAGTENLLEQRNVTTNKTILLSSKHYKFNLADFADFKNSRNPIAVVPLLYNNSSLNNNNKSIGVTVDGFEIIYGIKGLQIINNGSNKIYNNKFIGSSLLIEEISKLKNIANVFLGFHILSAITVKNGSNTIANNIFDSTYQVIESINATDTIKNNKISNCNYPIKILNGNNTCIYNNLMVNNGVIRNINHYQGSSQNQVPVEGVVNIVNCSNTVISNNTFHNNTIEDHQDIRIEAIRSTGTVVVNNCSNSTIKNNIFYANQYINWDNRENDGMPVRPSTDVAVYNSPKTQIINNSLQNAKSFYTAANFCDFTIITNSLNMFGRDPQFVGTGDNPYSLKASSPCIYVGTNAVENKDILGIHRSFITCLGAYELQSNVCPTGSHLFVDSSVSASGDGSSWQKAFKTLDEALVTARHCLAIKEIFVASGTYKPSFKLFAWWGGEVLDAEDRAVCFHIRDGLMVQGGFPSSGGNKNSDNNITILDGDIGIPNNTSDNAYHVVLSTADSAHGKGIILDGFTITNGNANSNSNTNFYSVRPIGNSLGGGIYTMFGFKNLIVNCTIKKNYSSYSGGGLISYRGVNRIENNLFTQNKSAQYGGAISIDKGFENNITNNTFTEDTAGFGGAVCIEKGKNNRIAGNLIKECYANALLALGGGIYTYKDTITIDSNIIIKNKANFSGGGICVTEGINIVKNNFVDGNSASLGGGIALTGGYDTLVNNVISNNNGTTSIGGVVAAGAGCNVTFINNSIVKNYAPQTGGVGINLSAVSSFTNNIFWDNKAGNSADVSGADFYVDANNSTSNFKNNLLQRASNNYNSTNQSLGLTGSGNYFKTDPGFINIGRITNANGIYRTAYDGLNLKSTSSLLGKGIQFSTYTLKNVLGVPRGKFINIGAY